VIRNQPGENWRAWLICLDQNVPHVEPAGIPGYDYDIDEREIGHSSSNAGGAHGALATVLVVRTAGLVLEGVQ
jgi:hypothetical protein